MRAEASKTIMSQQKLSLEEFLKAPRIDCMDDPGCTMSDIFGEIKRKTGASYEELGGLADISVSGAARLVRGGEGTVYLQDANLATFIRRLRLPFKRALYVNAASKFAANVSAGDLSELNCHDDTGRAERQTVYSYVKVSPAEYEFIGSVDELRVALARSDTPRETLRDIDRVPRHPDDRILVRHQSANMLHPSEIKYLIQPGAILEVQWVNNHSNIATGEIVMAQIGHDMACAYVYGRHSSPGAVREEFRSTTPTIASKTCSAGTLAELSRQRLILGRVICLHYDFT